jgi:hypothetical protein
MVRREYGVTWCENISLTHVNTPANHVPVTAVSQIKAIHVYDFDNTCQLFLVKFYAT